jgi:hypothetical protein
MNLKQGGSRMKKLLAVVMTLFVMFSVAPVFAGDTHDGFGMSDKVAVESGKELSHLLNIKGHYKIELFSPDGELKDVREGDNYVVQNGIYSIMDQILASPTLVKMGWMAVGTGSISGTCTANGVVLNTLTTEVDRNAFDSKLRTNGVVTVIGIWSAGDGTGAITEAGTFSHSSTTTSDMWMCASFAVINKGAADTLQITWTLTGS